MKLRYPVLAAILFLNFPLAAGADETSSSPFTPFLQAAGISVPGPAAKTAPVQLVSAKQDFKHITFDVSCHLLTPIQIGDVHFAKGLGMHANGNAVFLLNGKFTHFTAKVGIDNNSDTAGRGSATFAVKVDGKQVALTPVLHGRDAPQSIDVPLDGAKQLELIVSAGGDSIQFDQSDWGDASVTDTAGKRYYLSDFPGTQTGGPVFFQQAGLPCSFIYGRQPAATLLPTWPPPEKPSV